MALSGTFNISRPAFRPGYAKHIHQALAKAMALHLSKKNPAIAGF